MIYVYVSCVIGLIERNHIQHLIVIFIFCQLLVTLNVHHIISLIFKHDLQALIDSDYRTDKTRKLNLQNELLLSGNIFLFWNIDICVSC